jgi:uncharacterized protein YutE (UPF0331/DUF86 family)
MRDLLQDLAAMEDPSVDHLREDRLLRLAVERALIQLVELATSINTHVAAASLGRAPGSYPESFDMTAQAGLVSTDLAQRLKRFVGLRNILTHQYIEVDLKLVSDAIIAAQTDYRRYVTEAAQWRSSRRAT